MNVLLLVAPIKGSEWMDYWPASADADADGSADADESADADGLPAASPPAVSLPATSPPDASLSDEALGSTEPLPSAAEDSGVEPTSCCMLSVLVSLAGELSLLLEHPAAISITTPKTSTSKAE